MKNQFKDLMQDRRFGQLGCPTGSAEARQIGLFWLTEKAAAATGCPVDFQEAAEFEVLPEGRTDQGEQASEAVRPLAQKGSEAQEHISQQGGPDLPFDGALAGFRVWRP